MVGNNTVAIVNIVDVEGCIGNVITTEDILVRELPDLDLTITETILSVLETTQNYLFLYYVLSFNLNILEGSTNNTLNIDATGLIGGAPYTVSPPNTTNYTLHL